MTLGAEEVGSSGLSEYFELKRKEDEELERKIGPITRRVRSSRPQKHLVDRVRERLPIMSRGRLAELMRVMSDEVKLKDIETQEAVEDDIRIIAAALLEANKPGGRSIIAVALRDMAHNLKMTDLSVSVPDYRYVSNKDLQSGGDE